MRLNPFTARPNDPLPAEDGRHVVKPAGAKTFTAPMAGRRLSHHCNEAEWDLQAMGEVDMRNAESGRREGMQRSDPGGPRQGGHGRGPGRG
jgi:hypothetical protein